MRRDGLMLLLAFAGTVALVPPVRRLAQHAGLIDKPAARKLHLDPTPLLGGLAMYVAAVLVIFAFLEREVWEQVWAIMAGGTLLFVVGLVDDAVELPARVKLFVAMPAAALLLIASGIQPVYPANLLFPPESWAASALGLSLSLLWIVGVTAAFAILDHMDGLCAGVAAIAAAFFYGLAVAAGQLWVSVLARDDCWRGAGVSRLELQTGQDLHGRWWRHVPRFHAGRPRRKARYAGLPADEHMDGSHLDPGRADLRHVAGDGVSVAARSAADASPGKRPSVTPALQSWARPSRERCWAFSRSASRREAWPVCCYG